MCLTYRYIDLRKPLSKQYIDRLIDYIKYFSMYSFGQLEYVPQPTQIWKGAFKNLISVKEYSSINMRLKFSVVLKVWLANPIYFTNIAEPPAFFLPFIFKSEYCRILSSFSNNFYCLVKYHFVVLLIFYYPSFLSP